MIHRASLEDSNFRSAFEALRVEPEGFDHAAHVRLAYVYLCEHAVDDAVARMKRALLAFLTRLGVGDSGIPVANLARQRLVAPRFVLLLLGSPAGAERA